MFGDRGEKRLQESHISVDFSPKLLGRSFSGTKSFLEDWLELKFTYWTKN